MINNAIDVIKVLLETKKEKPMALKKFDLLKQTKKKFPKIKKMNEWMLRPSKNETLGICVRTKF